MGAGHYNGAVRSRTEHSEHAPDATNAELGLLSEVRRTPETTQRHLARRLGISLGLTNLLMKGLASKGYVKVMRASWQRRLYALTPQGMMHRLLLTGAYVGRFLDQYHSVKLLLRDEIAALPVHAESRLALYGTGEFAELIYLGLKEIGIQEVDIYAWTGAADARFLGVVPRPAASLRGDRYDRVLIASLDDPEKRRIEVLALGVAAEQIITFFEGSPSTPVNLATGAGAGQRRQ